MKNPVRAHAIITGRVQGVCFRMETCRAVAHMNVSGWVRNRHDGSVEAIFEGERADVEAALAWCRQGPSLSRVDHVRVSWRQYVGDLEGFTIAY